MDFSLKSTLTVANVLSALRILLVPVIGWLLFVDTALANVWACALLMFAIATDFLDGLAARMLNQVSDLGKIIDPLADKLFIIFLGVAFIFLRDFPVWLAVLIVAKDVAIVAAGVYVGRRRDVVMQSNWIGKYTFGFQALLMFSYFLRVPYGIWSSTFFTVLFIFLTLFSYGRAGLRLLRGEQQPQLSRHTEFLLIWGRRWSVFLLTLVYATHLYFWAFENNQHPEGIVNLPGPSADQALALAQEYAPVFEFTPSGRAPVSAESYPGSGVMMRGGRHLLGLLDSVELQFPIGPGENIPIEGTWDTYLVPGDPVDSAPPTPTVYARVTVVDDPEGEIMTVVMYWLLFEREDAPIPRQGDWQLTAIYLSSSGEPLYAALTQGWNAVVRSWDAAPKSGARPLIYVGEHSNMFAFEPGRHSLYLDQENIFPAGNDEVGGGEQLQPDSGYRLVMLSGKEPWLNWRGRWGGPFPGGDRGPRYWNPKDPRRTPWAFPLRFLRFYLRRP